MVPDLPRAVRNRLVAHLQMRVPPLGLPVTTMTHVRGAAAGCLCDVGIFIIVDAHRAYAHGGAPCGTALLRRTASQFGVRVWMR